MAIPVINSTQNVLAVAIGQVFSFRFVASNNPTSWSIASNAALPTGFVLNTTSGVLSGYGINPGIWTLPMIASNSDGSSLPVTFTLGIFQTSNPSTIYRDVYIGLDSRSVTLPNPRQQLTVVDDPTKAAPTALFTIPASDGFEMYGDDALWRITFTKASEQVYPKVISARMSLKGTDDGDPFFTTSVAQFTTANEYINGNYDTKYYLFFSLQSDDLLSYIQQFESPSTTEANCIGEIELNLSKPATAPGPDVLKVTTSPFILRVRRDTVR